MKLLVPSPLLSYTSKRELEARGATIGAVLADLDSRFPGIRFRIVDEQDRIRPHIRIFVNGTQVPDLGQPLAESDTVQIIQALSGG